MIDKTMFGSVFGFNKIRYLAEEICKKSNEDIIRINICNEREECDALNFITELNKRNIYNDFDINDKGHIQSITFTNLGKVKQWNDPLGLIDLIMEEKIEKYFSET